MEEKYSREVKTAVAKTETTPNNGCNLTNLHDFHNSHKLMNSYKLMFTVSTYVSFQNLPLIAVDCSCLAKYSANYNSKTNCLEQHSKDNKINRKSRSDCFTERQPNTVDYDDNIGSCTMY